METKLEVLFKELAEAKSISRRAELNRDIRVIRSRLVRNADYEGLLHMLRFLKNWEKDKLFVDLLNKWSDSSLFVIAFADSNMYSYKTAYEKALSQYDNDEEAMNEDVLLLFDEKLMNYLCKYSSIEDLKYVQILTDGADWLKSNMKSNN